MVWCALTAFTIFDSMDYFIDLGFHPNSFFVQPLINPETIHINNLKYETRLSLAKILNDRIQSTLPNAWLYKSYKVMLDFLNITDSTNKIELVQNYLLELDTRRQTNGVNLFAHLL
jgi:hypothetical protein